MLAEGETKSKGYTIKGAMAFIENEYGPEGLLEVIDNLDTRFQEILNARIVPSDWYPFAMQVSIYETTDRLFGTGNFSLCRKIGRFTAEFELSTIHKMVMKIGGPERLLKLSAMMWGRYYSLGKLKLESRGPGKGVARVVDFDPISKAFCMDLEGWMNRTVELTGSRIISLLHTDCILDGCTSCAYEGEWE